MIVPGNRLLFCVVVLLPFAALAGLIPLAAVLCGVLAAVLVLLAVSDAVRALNATCLIRVTTPETVRLSIDRIGQIPIMITNLAREPGSEVLQADRPSKEMCRGMVLRLGLALPAEIEAETPDVDVLVPSEGRDSSVLWPCRATSRGSYRIERCYFEFFSPLRLWRARGVSLCNTEVRVYPNLMGERRRLAALFLDRGGFGMHPRRLIGQGRDFERLRDYIPGDSYDDIDWKATAKRGRPVTKLYQVERTQEIYVVMDTSRLSGKPVNSEAELEYFIRAALVLGLAAERQGDLFGLLTFADRVRRFVRAGTGRSHFNVCRDALYTIGPELTTPDYDEMAAFVRLRLRRRALIMILTDLTDPVLADSFLKSVDLLCRQHVVLVHMIRQPGVQPLFTAADVGTTDDVYCRLGQHMLWHKIRELDKSLKRKGVGLFTEQSEKLSACLVTEYMRVKARQML